MKDTREQNVVRSAETGEYQPTGSEGEPGNYKTEETHLSPWRKEVNRLVDEIELGNSVDENTVALVIHIQMVKRDSDCAKGF